MPANNYVRILIIGLVTMAIGSAIVGLASVDSGTDLIILGSLGGLVIVGGVVLFVTGFLGQGRARPGTPTFASPRVIVRDYVAFARSSPGRMVRVGINLLFWCWAAIAFVLSMAHGQWALAAVYGVVPVCLLVLFFMTGSAIDRPGDSG